MIRGEAARGPLLVVSLALFILTVLKQHPNRGIDLLPRSPRVRWLLGELLPDWRFFAPRPAMHDLVIHMRTRDADGDVSPWTAVTSTTRRSLSQLLFFPTRRSSKATIDVCNRLLPMLASGRPDPEATSAYRLLVAHLRRHISDASITTALPEGFQFCITRDEGYATETSIDIPYCSAYIPWADAGEDRHGEGSGR